MMITAEEIEDCVQDLANIRRFLSVKTFVLREKINEEGVDALHNRIEKVQKKLREKWRKRWNEWKEDVKGAGAYTSVSEQGT